MGRGVRALERVPLVSVTPVDAGQRLAAAREICRHEQIALQRASVRRLLTWAERYMIVYRTMHTVRVDSLPHFAQVSDALVALMRSKEVASVYDLDHPGNTKWPRTLLVHVRARPRVRPAATGKLTERELELRAIPILEGASGTSYGTSGFFRAWGYGQRRSERAQLDTFRRFLTVNWPRGFGIRCSDVLEGACEQIAGRLTNNWEDPFHSLWDLAAPGGPLRIPLTLQVSIRSENGGRELHENSVELP